MKFLFATVILIFSLGVYAHPSKVFNVSIYATVEDDIEAILNTQAASLCGDMLAKRISSVRSNYKPYQYYIRAWADFVCVE